VYHQPSSKPELARAQEARHAGPERAAAEATKEPNQRGSKDSSFSDTLWTSKGMKMIGK